MSNYGTIPGYAIVQILKEDHDRKLFKEVTLANGKVLKLSLDILSSGLYDDHFSQGVSLAKVIATGEGVDWVFPGEVVVVDYTIDTAGGKIISDENGVKTVRANALNEFYTESKLISATTTSRYDTYEYKAGDLKSSSTIFGVIRGDEIIPNHPYVLLKYVNVEGQFEQTPSGLLLPSSEGELVIRQVLFAHPDSKLKSGDNIMVDFEFLYERDVNDEIISICMEDDIISVLK
jgi:hypothetical protein